MAVITDKDNPNHKLIKAFKKAGFTNIEFLRPTNNNRFKSFDDGWHIDSDQYSGHAGYTIKECLWNLERGFFKKR